MAKSQYTPAQSLIEEIAPIWQDRVGLAHFEIEHAFLDSYFGDDGEEDFKITATTEVRWNYMQAKIKWYLPSMIRHSMAALERTLVHEYMHVLLAPEQTLIDVKLDEHAMTMRGDEVDVLQDRFYEQLELATELATRAVMSGWKAQGGLLAPA